MASLTIVTNTQYQIKPLLESAIENELKLLEAGLRKTNERLKVFENRYKLQTSEFITKYENDEIKESVDFEDWVGESRLISRLNEKISALRGIRFEN